MPSPKPLTAHDPAYVGPYRVVGYLGAGGQGSVYLAEDQAGTQVAVKVLHPHFARSAEARKRFVREVEVAERVSAYTARVLAVAVHRDVPFIVSQYIPGDSLADVVETGGPRDADELQRLATGTLTALAAIHTAGIVHCDFKPDNVLRGPDGWRVIDFGIARALDTIEPHTSRRIGTPAYMAPEQIEQRRIGSYTDMFAWGTTMAYAAAGVPAFGSQGHGDPGGNAVMRRILNDEPDLAGLPDGLRDLVARALDKDPSRRPGAHDALLSLIGRTPAPPREIPKPAPAAVRKRTAAGGAFAVRGPRVRAIMWAVPAVLLAGAVLLRIEIGGNLFAGTGGTPTDRRSSTSTPSESPATARIPLTVAFSEVGCPAREVRVTIADTGPDALDFVVEVGDSVVLADRVGPSATRTESVTLPASTTSILRVVMGAHVVGQVERTAHCT